jgi:hypothetical protein
MGLQPRHSARDASSCAFWLTVQRPFMRPPASASSDPAAGGPGSRPAVVRGELAAKPGDECSTQLHMIGIIIFIVHWQLSIVGPGRGPVVLGIPLIIGSREISDTGEAIRLATGKVFFSRAADSGPWPDPGPGRPFKTEFQVTPHDTCH